MCGWWVGDKGYFESRDKAFCSPHPPAPVSKATSMLTVRVCSFDAVVVIHACRSLKGVYFRSRRNPVRDWDGIRRRGRRTRYHPLQMHGGFERLESLYQSTCRYVSGCVQACVQTCVQACVRASWYCFLCFVPFLFFFLMLFFSLVFS